MKIILKLWNTRERNNCLFYMLKNMWFIIIINAIGIHLYTQVIEYHPRFNKLINKYQTLENYFAQSTVKVISKNLIDGSIQKQWVNFDIGYSSSTKYTYFEKSHLKMIDSEQTIEIVSDGKNVYKYVAPLNQYTKTSLKDKSVVFDNINDLTLNLIYAPERIFNDIPKKIKSSELQYKVFESFDIEVLYIKGKKDKELFFLILYIRKSDGLLYRWVLKTIHIHGKNRFANILKARYYNVRYNIESDDIKKMFKFQAPADAQYVEDFDIAKYYEDVQHKLKGFVGSKLELPKIKVVNYQDNALDLQSKYIFIDIWATWCKVCKSEIPFLNKLYKKYKNKLEVFAISYESERVLEKFISSSPTKIEYKIASYDRKKAVEPYKLVVQYPTAFLLDSEFKLKKVWVGEKNIQKVMNYFEKIFKE